MDHCSFMWIVRFVRNSFGRWVILSWESFIARSFCAFVGSYSCVIRARLARWVILCSAFRAGVIIHWIICLRVLFALRWLYVGVFALFVSREFFMWIRSEDLG